MSKNLISLIIILFVIAAGILGIFFVVNPKEQNKSNLNVTKAVYETQTPPPTATPTSVIITPTIAIQIPLAASSSSTITMADGLQIQD